MPVCSYLVYPEEGKAASLLNHLNTLPCCEATKADNEDLIILITETDSKQDDEFLQNTLKEIPEITGMALTFGQLQTDFN